MTINDLPELLPWVGEAIAAAHGGVAELGLLDVVGGPEGTPDPLIIAPAGSPERIGLLNYWPDDPGPGWLTIAVLLLAKRYRGFGYGSEAVRLIEEWAVRKGSAERFWADVDVRNGLGLYFWLRLGYRPEAAMAGKRRREVVSMVREAN